jgi:hypothetical protein
LGHNFSLDTHLNYRPSLRQMTNEISLVSCADDPSMIANPKKLKSSRLWPNQQYKSMFLS